MQIKSLQEPWSDLVRFRRSGSQHASFMLFGIDLGVGSLWAVAREGHAPVHGGAWTRATVEVCLAVLASASERKAIMLRHQSGLPPTPHPAP